MKPQNTGVFLFVPAIFDASLFPELRGLENEAHWLLHKIVTTAARQKHDKNFDGMSHISMQTMDDFMASRNSSRVKECLIRNGVIVHDDSYLTTAAAMARGVKPYSMAYGLTPAYSGPLRMVEVTKAKLAAKIVRHRLCVHQRPVAATELNHTLAYLERWLRRTRIDTEAAYEAIASGPEVPAKIVKRKVGKKGRRRIIQVAIPSSRVLNRMVVDTIHQGAWEFDTCAYGRVHSNITRLMTECRACLSIDGEPLASIDITNSQLIFFTILMIERIIASHNDDDSSSSNPDSRSSICQYLGGEGVGDGSWWSDVGDVDDENRGLGRNGSEGQICQYLGGEGWKEGNGRENGTDRRNRMEHIENSQHQNPDGMNNRCLSNDMMVLKKYLTHDQIQFITDVMNGTVYNKLMSLSGYTSRREFKDKFFEGVLYGDCNAYYSRTSPVTRAFKQAYPSVWQFIVEVKQPDGTVPEQDAYKVLSRQMQVMESSHMIGRVCGRLAQYHPDIPVVTVHDSIMTPAKHMPTVHRIMVEEFLRIGFRPTFKIEGMGDEGEQQAA